MLPAPQCAPRRRRPLLLAALCGIALAAAACGSSTATSVAGPTPPRCQVAISGTPAGFPPSGGSGTVTVTTDRDCTWNATSGASWIALSGSTSGQGNGSFPFSVAANTVVAPRSANIAVNGQNFAVSQQPAACSFSVSPLTISAASSGGSATVTVQAQSGCAWTAASNADWISIAVGASGNGNATVQLAIAANAGGVRSGTVTAAGQTVTVTQAAASLPPGPPPPPPPQPSCSFVIAPTSLSVPATGGAGTVSVTTDAGCMWTAVSPVPWVVVTAGSTGTGSGSVAFAVDVNTGGPRSTSLSIAGQTFTVSQAAMTCSYAVSPTSATIAASGGTLTITVDTASSCTWTATSNDSWMTIQSGASGTGAGTVTVSVDSNGGGRRNGTLTVAGQTVSVQQDSAKTASLSGPVNGLSGACPTLRFQVTGVAVATDSSTAFVKGPCKSIQDGTNVDVQGFVQPDSSVLATQVTLLKL